MKVLFFIIKLFSYLPLWWHYFCSDIFYFFVYHVVGYRKRIVRKNLKDSFPTKTKEELREIERKFYGWFCDYIVESIKMLTISEKEMKRRLVFKGTERVEQSVRNGRSCGVYLGHLGNWEWITSLPLWINEPSAQCAQIYHVLENKDADAFFLKLRERWGALCIPMAETMRKIVAQENAGKRLVIGFISDQTPFWNNIHYWTNFLNHDTPVFTGTERIIKKRGFDAYYMHVTMPRRGYYECEFRLLTDKASETGEFEITEMYMQALEENIKEIPYIWLWSHNRWKRTREQYNKIIDPETNKMRR